MAIGLTTGTAMRHRPGTSALLLIPFSAAILLSACQSMPPVAEAGMATAGDGEGDVANGDAGNNGGRDGVFELAAPRKVVTVTTPEPRYALPESLSHWGGTRTAPLYADPDVKPWAAQPTEERLRNAAVSCNYKDEGGVRGRVTLLVDDFKVTRFKARIEMPNGGICLFDDGKMKQRPFEQGLSLKSANDDCLVRMWEQQSRITVAAYNCHRQCSKGSFSYLWPILMDTRLGTCY